MKNRKRILMTGGHAGTTALAVIEELDEHKLDIYWIGSQAAFEGKKVKTIEELAFDKSKIKTYKIPTGKINRKYPYKSIISLFKVPIGFLYAIIYVFRIRPRVVLSFGGSVSVPVVVVAWLYRIPIILHEQTITAGKSNLVMARFAAIIALSRQESAVYFPVSKVILTGNPISKSIHNIKPKNTISQNPKVLVFGGSRGASTINELLNQSINQILDNFSVYHISGQVDYAKQIKLKNTLSKGHKQKYHVFKFVDPTKMNKYYSISDIIVCRSGANTVSEILIAKRPCVLIPIPWTYNNEQYKNAQYVERLGLGVVLHQDKMDGTDLFDALQEIAANWNKMVSSVDGYKSPDMNAAKQLASIVLEYI